MIHAVVLFGRKLPNTYKKFVNTNGNARFARRHIFRDHSYRKISGPTPVDQV